jgi:hypothetical protein
MVSNLWRDKVNHINSCVVNRSFIYFHTDHTNIPHYEWPVRLLKLHLPFDRIKWTLKIKDYMDQKDHQEWYMESYTKIIQM